MVSDITVTYESVMWREHPISFAPRQSAKWQGKPYEVAIPAAIAGYTTSLPLDLLAEVDEAVDAIARFDHELGARLGPYGAVLLRTESLASSRIENLTASARKIVEAEVHGHGTRNGMLIAANTAAMRAAIEVAATSS